jgi:hypothetical protein
MTHTKDNKQTMTGSVAYRLSKVQARESERQHTQEATSKSFEDTKIGTQRTEMEKRDFGIETVKTGESDE